MIAFIPGVWDLLHVGHVEALEMAKLGNDKLIVGVPSDEVVKEDKGEYPVISLNHRMKMIRSIYCVDKVIPYYELDFLDPVKIAKPDIVILGNYQPEVERYKRLNDYCYQNNIGIMILPRNNLESSSGIKKRCQTLSI